MQFEEFPFDTQICGMNFHNLNGPKNLVVLDKPLIRYDPTSPDFHGNLEKHEYDVAFKTLETSEFCTSSKYCRSQGNIEITLTRKSRELQKYVTSFYFPTFVFSVMSLVSYLIPAETVPGRMGLLLTLYLISSNTFISVDAPNNRGFTFLDIWIFGNQLPIIIAIHEYGILLAISKYFDGCVFGKQVNTKQIDLVCFILTLVFMVLFDATYWFVGFGKRN